MRPFNTPSLLVIDLQANRLLSATLMELFALPAVGPLQLCCETLRPAPAGTRDFSAREPSWTTSALAAHIQPLVEHDAPTVVLLVIAQEQLMEIKQLLQAWRRPATLPVLVAVEPAGEVPAVSLSNELFQLLQCGAAECLTPPFTPMQILPRFWRVLAEAMPSVAEATMPSKLLALSRPLIGDSPAFLAAVGQLPLIANHDASVLIAGETGTGKELIARAIHELSRRASKSLIAVNCGALPVELVENELFGHERGAFTHASARQEGLIQAADGGTLFLDEVDSLPLLAQVKLLRFLQEKEYKPLGATKARRADVRIVAATNIEIEQAVRAGRLRQDLYYRLNHLTVTLPALRERRADIPALASYFLAKYNQEYHKAVRGFAPEALQRLALHDWPGNVRELEHIVARAVALTQRAVIQGAELQLGGHAEPVALTSFQAMKTRLIEQFERSYLQSLLIAHQGNISKAAAAAQKNRRAFFALLQKYGIKAEEFRAATGGPDNAATPLTLPFLL